MASSVSSADAEAFSSFRVSQARPRELLDPTHLGGTLENLQTEFEKRLGLGRIQQGLTEKDFEKVDRWLK